MNSTPETHPSRIGQLLGELGKEITDSPLPRCLFQFSLDWRSKEFRESEWFQFAAQCKGISNDEYSQFLDYKLSPNHKGGIDGIPMYKQ